MRKIVVNEIFGVPFKTTVEASTTHVNIHPDLLYKLLTSDSYNFTIDVVRKTIEVE
jgi:hypothetical protein